MKNAIQLIFCFCFLFCGQLDAQQLAHRSAFGAIDFHFNPAITAVSDYAEWGANYRQQWLSFDYAPTTATAYIQFPFVKNNMSVGGVLEQDEIGPFTRSSVALTYSYKIEMGRHGQLALGVKADLSKYRFVENNIIATDPNDVLFFPDTESGLAPNFGLGFFYVSDIETYKLKYNAFFIGLGVNQLRPSEIIFEDNALANLKREIHANAIIGGRIINDLGCLEPSVWVDYSAENIIHATGNLLFEMENTFWTGLSLSTDKSVGLQAGWNIAAAGANIRIGAMGVYNLGSLGQQQGLGFEFLAAFRFER